VLHRDLREPFDLDGPFDAVMTVATLHWLPDHQQVFAQLARIVRPGGRLVIEAGGHGNITEFLQAVGGDHADGSRYWNFADIPDTRKRLRGAGFGQIAVRLVADEARLENRAQLEAFVATVMLAAALREVPSEQRAAFVRDVCDRLPAPAIDFVRLQVEATRAPSSEEPAT
jgi:trans-aconitate 2-methyltransferase